MQHAWSAHCLHSTQFTGHNLRVFGQYYTPTMSNNLKLREVQKDTCISMPLMS